jgi:Family of unknown function (DUF6150)
MRLFLLFAICFLGAGFAKAQTSRSAYCDIKGAIFVVPDRSQAQYRVFIEASEAFADISVYKAPNALFADRSGLWFLTGTRAQAAYTIAFVKEKAMADFSIFYIDNESFAGCR